MYVVVCVFLRKHKAATGFFLSFVYIMFCTSPCCVRDRACVRVIKLFMLSKLRARSFKRERRRTSYSCVHCFFPFAPQQLNLSATAEVAVVAVQDMIILFVNMTGNRFINAEQSYGGGGGARGTST